MKRASISPLVWLQASRPKTLPAAIVPVVVGCTVAGKIAGQVDLLLAVCTLVGAMAIQVATNFFNDAIDARKGADTEARIGPRRATASGDVPPQTMMFAGLVMLLVSAACGAVLVNAVGWPILVVGLVSGYFAYGYTGGPVPLAYVGLGELFVLLFFGLVAVMGTVFVQLGELRLEALLAGGQVGLLSAVLISVNNLRDVATDGLVGKRTLAVRLGVTGGRQVIVWEVALAGMLAVLWERFGVEWKWWIFTGLPSCTVGVWVVWQILSKPPGRFYNVVLAISGLMLLSYGAIVLLLQ